MFNVFSNDFLQQLIKESSALPSEMMQAISVIGVFAIMLILYGHKIFRPTGEPVPSFIFGLGLGIACLAISFFLADKMQSTLKPTIILLDSIFIAGLIGGWRSATICFLCAALARYIFGGLANIELALFNYAPFIVAGVTAHWFFFPKIITQFRLVDLVSLILWRFIAGMLGILLLSFTWPEGSAHLIKLMTIRRILGSFTSSAIIITSSILLMRYVSERNRSLYINHASGLPNLRAFQYLLNDLFKEAERGIKRNRAIILIEVENMRQLTQVYGHDLMDRKSKKFADSIVQILEKLIPQHMPQVFSFSAKTSALVLTDTTSIELKRNGLPQKLLQEFLGRTDRTPGRINAVFSMGVLDVELSHENRPSHFLRTISMLEHHGSNQVQFFEACVNTQLAVEDYIRHELGKIITSGEAPLQFQPKVNLRGGICYGAEALLRFPNGVAPVDYVSPQDVIAVAEKYNLRTQLEEAIVKTGIATLAALPPHLRHLSIAVNVTPDMFLQPNFSSLVLKLLKKTNVEPHRLTIEVIETQRFDLTPSTISSLESLAKHGVRFSLDDFGTGYSSISLLSQLPFSELKLDRFMTAQLETPRGKAAIQLSIEGANKYQAHVVAEGIETEQQRETLSSMGVLYGQGYLFAKAMPLSDLVQFADTTIQTDDLDSPISMEMAKAYVVN